MFWADKCLVSVSQECDRARSSSYGNANNNAYNRAGGYIPAPSKGEMVTMQLATRFAQEMGNYAKLMFEQIRINEQELVEEIETLNFINLFAPLGYATDILLGVKHPFPNSLLCRP